MKNFEEGDLVKVINWGSPSWEYHLYEVTGSYQKYSKTYYNIELVEEIGNLEGYKPSTSGAFTAEYLRYVGPRRKVEVDLLKLSVPELASLIRQATDRIIELTKDA